MTMQIFLLCNLLAGVELDDAWKKALFETDPARKKQAVVQHGPAAQESGVPGLTLNVDKENAPLLITWLKALTVASLLHLCWSVFVVLMRFFGPMITPPRPPVPVTTEYLPGFEPDNVAGDLQMSDADLDRRLEKAVERVLERRKLKRKTMNEPLDFST